MPLTPAPCRVTLRHQRGAALLVFMLLFFLVSTSWLLSQATSSQLRNEADNVTSLALAQAKETLIGRAAADNNRPGSLPCPDIDADGKADGDFGYCSAAIGRLPWKTLDLPDLRDGDGNRLWYVLANELRDNEAAPKINPTFTLGLSLNGTVNIAAIVFSAGPPLADQNGRPSNVVADYLDGTNKTGGPYISGLLSPTFNDKLIAVSRAELFATVNQRILGELRGPDDSTSSTPSYGLRRYHNDHGTFPWADSDGDGFGDTGATDGGLPFKELALYASPQLPGSREEWLTFNNWLALVNYQRTTSNLITVAIGANSMRVTPCPSSPCP